MPQIFTTFEEVQCQDNGKIELRKEQLEAIKAAKDRFKQKAGNKFLWNAKMRFGKTVCALQLAKELGCSQTQISLILKGERNPSPENAVNICRAIKKNFDDIFFINTDYKRNQK